MFVDATAFDRMPEDFNPYGEYPDGTPCAYCLRNEGEVKPQGWNLIGPICRWCLGDWHRSGSELVFWRRQKCWAVAVLNALTTDQGARPPQNCDLILTGKLEPILQWKISQYAVAVHGSDDASPRRAQANLWINVCRSIQAAIAATRFPTRSPRMPPPDRHLRHPPHLQLHLRHRGHEELESGNSNSSLDLESD